MNASITQMIRACNGYFYETAGMISAFFSTPDQARACAEKLAKLVDVQICGTQLAIWL